jgi:hypothetical protein
VDIGKIVTKLTKYLTQGIFLFTKFMKKQILAENGITRQRIFLGYSSQNFQCKASLVKSGENF